MSVTLSPKARQDLDRIWSFTVARWGEAQAEAYLRRLAQAFADLADGSRPGQSADDIRQDYRRLTVGSHVVFYRKPIPGLVEVVRVLHQRMDVDRHL